ncbi:MAG: exo-alpha-sialidase [Phycisphaeraceae bacterium]|nr:exo-alpha-sialidase [Phycisphaeraceae bacterium]
MRFSTTFLMTGCLLAIAWGSSFSTARAEVLFADQFEATTKVPGVPNQPQVGSYATDKAVRPESLVVKAEGEHPTAPAAGANILHIAGKQRNYGDPKAPALKGQSVTLDLDIYVSSSGQNVSIGLIGDTGNESLNGNSLPIWLQIDNKGAVQSRSNKAWNNSGFSHPMDTWQHYTLSYTVGDPTFTLKVGDNPAGSQAINSPTAPSIINRLMIGGGAGNTLGYIDNITYTGPEHDDIDENSAAVPTAPTAPPVAESYPIRPSATTLQDAAQILGEGVLAKQPNRYIGWPDIVITEQGELLAVFSGDRDWHVCPWGKIMITRSVDGGVTWSQPAVAMDTPLDDRGTGLLVLPDGSLLLTFHASLSFADRTGPRYDPYAEYAKANITQDVRDKWGGFWCTRSTDGGVTWSEPATAPAMTPHGPTLLKDGRLLLPGGGAMYESTDNGQTWTQISQVPNNPQTWKSRYAFMSEAACIETDDGRIIALARYADGTDTALRQTVSEDGGKTWSEPTSTGMPGYPPHLLKSSNGWLVASYGRRIAPMGERACISKDNGRTWLVDQEIILSNAAPQGAGDLGYPASVQLPDSSIWTVYYQVEKAEDGEFPSLMGTHWRLR